MRKVAKKIADHKRGPFNLTLAKLSGYLGPERFLPVLKEKQDEVGLVTGLAWTQAGGDVLLWKRALFPAKGKLFSPAS